MSADSPVAVVFGTDGYEVSVKDNVVLENNINADGYVRGLLVAGSDGYKTHHIRTDESGNLSFKHRELATFNAMSLNTTTDSNKSLMSIMNTSTKTLRIEEIYLINVKTTSVTGVQGIFEMRRITGHSGGTAITDIEAYESGDILDAGVTVISGATVSGESTKLLWRALFTTDEHSVNVESVSSLEHIFQTMFPVFVKKTNNSKTITLKNNEGLNIKFTPNSNTGLFDIFCIFTQE